VLIFSQTETVWKELGKMANSKISFPRHPLDPP
jgi:hypothetical protein